MSNDASTTRQLFQGEVTIPLGVSVLRVGGRYTYVELGGERPGEAECTLKVDTISQELMRAERTSPGSDREVWDPYLGVPVPDWARDAHARALRLLAISGQFQAARTAYQCEQTAQGETPRAPRSRLLAGHGGHRLHLRRRSHRGSRRHR